MAALVRAFVPPDDENGETIENGKKTKQAEPESISGRPEKVSGAGSTGSG